MAILVDKVLSAAGAAPGCDSEFGVGLREVSRPARFAPRFDPKRISAPKVAQMAITGLEKTRDRPEA